MGDFHVSNDGLVAASQVGASLIAADHAVCFGPQAAPSALVAVSGRARLAVIYAGASNATIHAA